MGTIALLDPVEQLWLQIDKLHLGFLQTEECAQKLELKRKLEENMRAYLNLVPMERRFYFRITGEILYGNVLKHGAHFSPYLAGVAWDTLHTYANNLLTQPWRKEFREIKLYSGAYKHLVESQVWKAENILYVMGYNRSNSWNLVHEGPVDPDRLALISRDCLLARTECELLGQVWEGLSSKVPCSWEEIVAFRQDCVGSPSHAIRALSYRYHQRQAMQSNLYPNSEPDFAFPHVLHPHQIYPYTMPNCNPYPTHFPSAVPNVPSVTPVPNSVVKDTSLQNSGSVRSERVPPIEDLLSDMKLSDKSRTNTWESWEYVYNDLANQGYSKDLGERGDILTSGSKTEPRRKKSSTVKSPPFLGNIDLETLERLCYEDLGKPTATCRKGEKPSKLNEALKRVRKEEMKTSAVQTDVSEITRRTSVYDNIGTQTEPLSNRNSPDTMPLNRVQKADYVSTSITARGHLAEYTPTVNAPTSTKIEGRKGKKEKGSESDISVTTTGVDEVDRGKGKRCLGATWQCVTCTYLNPLDNQVCEMCAKSRSHGPESTPLTSGGKECANCTLINPRSARNCEVCLASLEDSPTYI